VADALGNGAAAVTFGVFATLMYDVISATNSSPQTTEINAKTRADTLMKWVHLGIGQGFLLVGMGALLEARANRSPWPPILGGGIAAAMLYAQYVHARNSGLQSSKPGTEPSTMASWSNPT
jgi:hypothetical protein